MLQVGVVDREVSVIFFKHPHGCSLNGKLANGVGTRFAIRGSNNFDIKPEKNRNKLEIGHKKNLKNIQIEMGFFY